MCRWHWLAMAPLVGADGPVSTTTTTTNFWERVCTECTCTTDAWEVGHTLESCSASCEMKSSVFNYIETDQRDSPNCACCSSLSISPSDIGRQVYKRRDVVTDYYLECPLCYCNHDWLGARSFGECVTSCKDYGRFQHANGKKPDGSTGDFNCGCCVDGPVQDVTWGVMVYSTVLRTPLEFGSKAPRGTSDGMLSITLFGLLIASLS
eukprot:symbB.v1.2.003090.t1/scaffold174.1/size397799/10